MQIEDNTLFENIKAAYLIIDECQSIFDEVFLKVQGVRPTGTERGQEPTGVMGYAADNHKRLANLRDGLRILGAMID